MRVSFLTRLSLQSSICHGRSWTAPCDRSLPTPPVRRRQLDRHRRLCVAAASPFGVPSAYDPIRPLPNVAAARYEWPNTCRRRSQTALRDLAVSAALRSICPSGDIATSTALRRIRQAAPSGAVVMNHLPLPAMCYGVYCCVGERCKSIISVACDYRYRAAGE